ncbi:hypothetical protein [Microbacterium pumilum]|uniref:Uncharacterized protein n=1 Tax=Microbacterium pumilum TaxID=344165 RepID=A0ABN2RX16_9MICO
MSDGHRAPHDDKVGPLHIVRRHFATDEGVYGVILVAGMIVASGSLGATAWVVFLQVVGTVLIFWAAHVYAGTVAHHGFEDGRIIGIRESFRAAVRRSWGLLVAALIPSSILLLGVAKIVPDDTAAWIALWICVAVLAVLGYIAFARRGARWYIRVLGALGTAGFGILMILLKSGGVAH